ncbi:Uncharacterised protein [Vibrio cholerae]|nr:Uncharacterised protein [Vibrio cholerae]
MPERCRGKILGEVSEPDKFTLPILHAFQQHSGQRRDNKQQHQ